MRRLIIISLMLLLFCASSFAQSALRLPSIIGDHMVLQQNAQVNIWGWADPRAEVMIIPQWSKDTIKVTAGVDTKWIAQLKTPKAGSAYSIIIKSKRDEITIKDVLMGEVWLCSGQSNMNWSAANGIKDMTEELKNQMSNKIRLFTVTKQSARYPQDDCTGEWKVCDAQSAKPFSAVGYFFGKRLFDQLGTPIGLINSSWGGTPAEAWALSTDINKEQKLLDSWKAHTKWQGSPINRGTIHNSMIYPLKDMTLAGAIWYQGEDNVANFHTYDLLMSTLIQSWRTEFAQELPFYFVQIAPYGRYKAGDRDAAILREKQAIVANITPKTGLVAIPDLVENVMDIHPRYKKEVGNRLAAWALTEVYNKNVGKYKQAQYKSMAVEGGKIRVSFKDAEGGLKSKGGALETFEIADKNMNFVAAEAEVDPKTGTVVVWSKEVKEPVAVRYSFYNSAIGNLIDAAGLPVMPFRSDADKIAASIIGAAKSASAVSTVKVGNAEAGEMKFEGKGFEKRTFKNGEIFFLNRTYKLVGVPEAFNGFEFLAHDAATSASGCVITPVKDGRVYVIARQNKYLTDVLKGWTIMPTSEFKYPTAKGPGILYIYYKEVKAGKSFKLPVTEDFGGITPIAKTIEYNK